MTDQQAEMDKGYEKARAIYNADIKHVVEPEHIGKYLVLNIETGDYEIDERLGLAGHRMRERFRPPRNGIPPLYTFRIGYPATVNEKP